VEIALQDFNKPIGVADYQLQFPEKQIKELICDELKKELKIHSSKNEK
jgi:hypothetical protein